MGLVYRLRQLWHNLRAQPLSPPQLRELGDVLSSRELALFQQMSASDQQHAYRVLQMLRAHGRNEEDLLAAALLHDVGKTRVSLSAWDRSVAVLGEMVAPKRAAAWGRGDHRGWRRAFVVREQHAAWGAALAEEAGSRPGVVDLIRRHQDALPANSGRQDECLLLLQWADDQN